MRVPQLHRCRCRRPLALTQPLVAQDTVGATIRFLAQAASCFPPCDTVQLIQAARQIGVYASGATRFLQMAERLPNGTAEDLRQRDSLEAWTTPAHYFLDRGYEDHTPYMTIRLEENVAKPGRIAAPPDTARFSDAPIGGDA